MSFDADETSTQDSAPRDLYQFTLPATTYYLASGVRSVSYNGHIWTAYQISRNEIGVDDQRGQKQLEITLPMKHPLCQRYQALGTPPKQISVTVYRLQLRSAQAILIWSGDITSMAFDQHMAKFLVPSRAARLLARTLPTVTAGRQCSHALYDKMCTVNRDSFKITTTVLQVDGRRIKVDGGAGHLNPWWVFGDVYHPATGERMDIVSQQDLGPPSTVVWLTMQAPIVGLGTGDSVEVSPGCDHTIVTCQSKFSNKDNYGGFPQMPSKNPFLPTGYGTVEQT